MRPTPGAEAPGEVTAAEENRRRIEGQTVCQFAWSGPARGQCAGLLRPQVFSGENVKKEDGCDCQTKLQTGVAESIYICYKYWRLLSLPDWKGACHIWPGWRRAASGAGELAAARRAPLSERSRRCQQPAERVERVRLIRDQPMEAFLCGGGAALVAITCTHPIDVVKTRLQVQGELGAKDRAYNGIVGSLGTIARREGVRGLYRGLLPAYGLQFSVTAVRFAVYDVQKRFVGEEFGKGATQGEQSTLRNFGMGCVSGMWGGVCGNPWFLVKSQFQSYSSDASLASVGTQHKHAGVLSAFATIWREQGVLGYWRGLTAFLPRVCIYSGVQVATYDGVKEFALTTGGLGDNFSTRLLCSSFTTFAAVTALQPFDFLSVRLMNQRTDANGRPAQYKHAVDCAAQTVRAEGLKGFFKGGLTNYARFTPYGILQLVLIEQFKELAAKLRTK